MGDGVQPLGEQEGEVELNLNSRPHLPHPGEEGEEEETDEEGKDGKEWKKYVEEEPQDLAVDEEKGQKEIEKEDIVGVDEEEGEKDREDEEDGVDGDEEVDEENITVKYERLRQKNIAEKNSVFSQLFSKPPTSQPARAARGRRRTHPLPREGPGAGAGARGSEAGGSSTGIVLA